MPLSCWPDEQPLAGEQPAPAGEQTAPAAPDRDDDTRADRPVRGQPESDRRVSRSARSTGLASSAVSNYGRMTSFPAAILANYSFGDDSALPGFSLPVGFKYIGSTGNLVSGAPSLLYGPGSNAWSITFMPTYQYKIFFARAEISHVGTSSTTPWPGVRPKRHQHGADPRRDRARHSVLSRPEA